MLPIAELVWKIHERLASSSRRYQLRDSLSVYHCSQEMFLSGVSRSNHVDHAWVESGLCKTDEEADGVDRTRTITFGGAECEDGPDEFHRRDPYAWTDTREDHVRCSNHVSFYYAKDPNA